MSEATGAATPAAALYEGPALSSASVQAVADVSPSYRRVSLSCPALRAVSDRGALSVELVLPGEGPERLRHRALGWFEPEAGELALDVPTSDQASALTRWAQRAAPGDQVGVQEPRCEPAHAEGYGCVVLAGDVTAAPTVRALLASLPADVTAHVLLEVPTAADALPTQAACAAHVTWLHPTLGDPPLAAALAGLPVFAVDHWWVCAEGPVAERIRDHLQTTRGVAAERVRVVPLSSPAADPRT